MSVIHQDRSQLTAPVSGTLFEGTVARTHGPADPLQYATGPEYRDAAELASILAQLDGLPVTLLHPDGLLRHGAVAHVVGRVIASRIDDDHAIASLMVFDPEALAAIEDGTHETSLGYLCTLDADRFQKSIVLDHLAIVPKGRCQTCALRVDGSACALRTDSQDAKCPCLLARSVPSATILPMKVADMNVEMTITLDEKSEKILSTLSQLSAEAPAVSGQETKAPDGCPCKNRAISHTEPENQMDLAELTKKLDEALAEIETLKASAIKADETSTLALNNATADLKVETARADKLAGEIEAVKAEAQAKVDAAQSARTDADNAAFAAAVDARVDLLADAAAVGIENAKSKTDREIKVAIVAKVDEMDIDDTRTADYVNGMYAGSMKRHTKAITSLSEVRVAIEETKVDAEKAAEKAAVDPYKNEAQIREAAEAKRKNRWRS